VQLSEHFSLEELIASEVAARAGIDNTPSEPIVAAGVETDQIIHEFGRWCHVAFSAPPQVARGELLTIASAAHGYQRGLNAIA
jgi:hypothetical protein